MNINIGKLVEAILKEDAAAASSTGGMVGPEVSVGKGVSVAYLPGGFTSKKKMKNTMDKEEKKGEVEVVKEQRSENLHNSYAKISKALTIDLRENKQIKRTISLLNYWLHIFPNSRYLSMSSKVAVDLSKFDKSVVALLDRIKNVYQDDIGNLQMLTLAVKQDRPLNAFEPFAEFDYAVGVRVQTEYSGIIMILELTVGLSMIPTNSLYIEHAGVLEELNAYRTVKVVKDMVWPVGPFFSPSIFPNIKEVIDNLDEK